MLDYLEIIEFKLRIASKIQLLFTYGVYLNHQIYLTLSIKKSPTSIGGGMN